MSEATAQADHEVGHETAPAAPEPPRKRYRLLAKAFMEGAVREAGHIFTLAEGELGPHRTVSHGPDIVHQEGDRDADREVAKARDEPLYEEVAEKPEVPIEERHERELEAFEQRAQAEYQSILARHEQELAAAKETTAAHSELNPAPTAAEVAADQNEYAELADEPEKARSIADGDWATRPEHGASAADANWPGAKPTSAPGAVRADQGPPTMNRPFVQSGPGHDPNRPT